MAVNFFFHFHEWNLNDALFVKKILVYPNFVAMKYMT